MVLTELRTSRPNWLDSLKAFNSGHTGEGARDEHAIEIEVQELLLAKRREERAVAARLDPTTASIPTFYKPKPGPNSIKTLVKKEARLRSLQSKNAQLLDNDELEKLWYLLRENTSGPTGDGEVSESINYDHFCQVAGKAADMFGFKCSPFFTPSVFLKFEKDAYGRIAILSLFHFIMRKTAMLQTRIFLSYHDSQGDGYLTEAELEEYVTQLIPAMPHLSHLEGSFRLRYIEIACRKFMFFHGKQGRVRIRDLLTSPVLTEFFELRQEVRAGEGAPGSGNWFTLTSTHRVYTLFLDLDADMTGTLSQEELANFPSNPNWQGGGLSALFINRVFEEHVMRRRGGRGKKGEMDLRSFLDFVLAWENKKHPASLAYFMSVLDLKRVGYITSIEIYVFFREVHKMWIERGFYAELSIEDVKDEVFDMIKPADGLRVYPADLMACKQQDIVVSILGDVGGFWAYDNRESLVQTEE